MVNGRYKKSVCDVKVLRGADVNSVHHLVLAKVKMKLCRNLKPKESNRKMYGVNKLKDPKISKGFQIEPRNRFQQLVDDENTINEKWTLVKESYNETTDRKDPGPEKKEAQRLANCRNLQSHRYKEKTKGRNRRSNLERVKEIKREEYKTKDKAVKRSARGDKRKNLEDVANQAENAANTNRLNKVYQLTKQLCGRRRNRTSGIRSKNGDLIFEDGKILERWKEHFGEVPNVPTETMDLREGCIIHENEIKEIDTTPIREEEVEKAIQKVKRGKSPGIDNINAELLKESVSYSTAELT
ncbi:uncharacterized protein LOC134281605 [Saccostrea cucullata]|uniref:uncharacterized protein LOC134281605 n=1 Tax=Saccostrea cuccullata TaxID=36930 RepID=UPI002ED5112F